MTGPGAFWYNGAAAQVLATTTFTGSGDLAVTQPTIAGTGTLTLTGSGALAVSQPALAGVGTITLVGAGALAVSQPAVDGAGTVTASTFDGLGALAIIAPQIAGTGNVTSTEVVGFGGGKRKYILDVPHERQKREPEKRPEKRTRRVPAVRVGLSLPLPVPVLALEVTTPEPVAAHLALPRAALPGMFVKVTTRTRLELALDRVDELEAVLAAVLED